MRTRIYLAYPVMLALVAACFQGPALGEPAKAAKSAHPTQPIELKGKREQTKANLKSLGTPQIKETILTPEQVKAQQEQFKKLDMQEQEARRKQKEAIMSVVADLKKQGINVHKDRKHPAWRLIVPALAKVSDAKTQKAQATQLAGSFKKRLEPILKEKVQVELYSDPKETRKIKF